MEDQALYAEVASAWRHFAAWREKTLAGYLTILAGLGFGFSQNVSAPIRAALLLGGVAVSIVFWILDVRNNQLLNVCQAEAQRLEASKGGYSALASARSTPRAWLTYSRAMDVLVGTVIAGCGAGGTLYLVRVFAERTDLIWLSGTGGLLCYIFVFVLHRIRTADSRRPPVPEPEAKARSRA